MTKSKIMTIKLETWETMKRDTEGNLIGPPGTLERKWRVLQVTNSIQFFPNQELSKEDVEYLTQNDSWKVTIVGLQS